MNELIKKWNKSSGEVWKDAWKSKNIGSSLSGIVGGLTNVISSGASNTETKSTAAEESLINNVASTQFGEGNLDTLLSDFNSNALAESNYSGTDLRGLTTGQQIGNTLKGIGSGAIAGAKVGGIWGALAGGVIGLGSGIIGSAIGNKRAKDKAVVLNQKAEEANASYLNNYSNSVENTQNTMFNNSLLNIASYGGPMYNHSGNWTNGLVFINEGGLHSENPFEGVQIGVDPQGIPNLVEEGEVIWNDYVFSNRLKPTKKQLEDNGLNKKYEGWTFAKIVEDIQKESADNPIDFISQNTLEDNLNTLKIMQEETRMKKQNNKFSNGGKVNKFDGRTQSMMQRFPGYSYSSYAKQLLKNKEAEMNTNIINRFLDNYGPEVSYDIDYAGMGIKVPKGGSDVDIPHFVHFDEEVVNEPSLREEAGLYGDKITPAPKATTTPTKVTVNTDAGRPVNYSLASDNKTTNDNTFNWQSLGRYAPIVADASTLLSNIFSKPDYSNAEAGLKAMRDIPVVNTTPIGNYLQLDNLDRNYYLNPILASSRSTARSIQNQGLNAGQTIAGLMSNQYNTNRAVGDALVTMDRENMARDLQEAQFNLGIDQYNANQAMQAQQMNQQRAFNIAQAEANAAQMREAIDAQRTAAISQGLSGLSEGLAGIGTESVYRDWLGALTDTEAIKDVFGAAANARKTKKACGGKMLTKKRK